jgi:hypothetical protein
MDRCRLKAQQGAVLCAAGFNIRWLLRAITRRPGLPPYRNGDSAQHCSREKRRFKSPPTAIATCQSPPTCSTEHEPPLTLRVLLC